MPRAKILTQPFFNRPTLVVAPELLGKYLVRARDGQIRAYMLTEVEAYTGPEDLAAHSAKGRTPRTEVMFGPAGVWYVYFVYGMHHMLNIVTEEPDSGTAILIRGVETISGPGRLTKQLGIDRSLNRTLAVKQTGLWIEDRGVAVAPGQILTTPRIGVDYAGPIWAAKPYRFLLTS